MKEDENDEKKRETKNTHHTRDTQHTQHTPHTQHTQYTQDALSSIQWYDKQIPRIREKRFNIPPTDPMYKKQWHLHHLNIEQIWKKDIAGQGVTVAVVDDGLEWKNEDLFANYNAKGSYDVLTNKADPSPKYNTDIHGTSAAGVVAAVSNRVCGVGIAPLANVSGIRYVTCVTCCDTHIKNTVINLL